MFGKYIRKEFKKYVCFFPQGFHKVNSEEEAQNKKKTCSFGFKMLKLTKKKEKTERDKGRDFVVAVDEQKKNR